MPRAAPRLAPAEVAHRDGLILQHEALVAPGARGLLCLGLSWASLARDAVLEAPAGERHLIAESPVTVPQSTHGRHKSSPAEAQTTSIVLPWERDAAGAPAGLRNLNNLHVSCHTCMLVL